MISFSIACLLLLSVVDINLWGNKTFKLSQDVTDKRQDVDDSSTSNFVKFLLETFQTLLLCIGPEVKRFRLRSLLLQLLEARLEYFYFKSKSCIKFSFFQKGLKILQQSNTHSAASRKWQSSSWQETLAEENKLVSPKA